MPPAVANARFDFAYTVNGASVLAKLNSLVWAKVQCAWPPTTTWSLLALSAVSL